MTCDICGRYEDDWTRMRFWENPSGERVVICPVCFNLLGGWKGMLRKLAREGELEDSVNFLRELRRREAI